jgi:ATP-dependent helicase/nuclease subunit A
MTESTEQDSVARHVALDVTRSFIVQAPAGSGKTSLLIQRFLALLATVDQPEAIVAMTFTKKAAGEILERTIDALRAAHNSEPAAPHDALTWRLARSVLERDAALQWHLLEHPARLRILTIDALCSAIARQAPLTVKLGSLPGFVEYAWPLYTEAAQEELDSATATDTAWQTLLDYLDNDADRVVRLLATMLGKRDQWLRHLVGHEARTLRDWLEQALATEIESELAALAAQFPRAMIAELLVNLRFAAAQLGALDAAHPLRALAASQLLPPRTVAALGQWQALANWLLTAKGGFLRRLTIAEGFPPKGKASASGSAERSARKRSMLSLLHDMGAIPGLAATLHRTRMLPPASYDETGWAFVEALLQVLPRVAARLRLVFSRRGAVDFVEATLIALRALGTDEPSDLLLAMDMRIVHLLVDEFQDTSFAQGELVRRLTAGWAYGDGRTLFVVGDPMQSIYGFREADVGLFIAAQRDRRLGSVLLETLSLSRNFRSRPELVEWVNQIFPQVLPAVDDAARGAVAFKAAVAARTSDAIPAVTLDLLPDARSEAGAVVRHVQSALQNDMQSIAVLVRKRSDLEDILPALRESGIAFAAVGLDRLTEQPALSDLMSLTHALLQPADRLAWLSTLRAPWCGLNLPDVFAVAANGDAMAERVTDVAAIDAVEGISADGRSRMRRYMEAIRPALARRGRVPLPSLIRDTWLALGGPACMANSIDLAATDKFFALLAAQAKGGDVPDWSAFSEALAALYVEPDASADTRVQIMTLHRAKGLEFDVVVLPGLARRTRGAEQQLLQWREREWGLLLAPLKARTPGAGESMVYAYLRTLAADASAAELGRLLYVGCTRARERLHLTAQARIDDESKLGRRWQPPAKGTSLAALWPALAGNTPVPTPTTPAATLPISSSTTGIMLQRLELEWRLPSPPPAMESTMQMDATAERDDIAFDWARENARQVGIAAHRALRLIAEEGIERWDAKRVATLQPRVEHDFLGLGFTVPEAQSAAALVIEGIANTLVDPRGRWLFDAQHVEATSEYALTGERDRALVRVVLDRTFVDVQGTRWIVDFKLSRHEGVDRDAFLDREQARYREQLETYAQVMRGLDPRPLRVGLYFPLLRGWREWDASG